LLLSLLFGSQLALAADTSPVQVKLETSMGEIVLELYPDKAPKTVANFLRYLDEGFYNGSIFHRVIDGFMIQGGGFDAQFVQKPTHAAIENEADNGLLNTIGSIAMARTSAPHSATAQFFINVNDNSALDFSSRNARGWGYAVFGRVVSGMDVVNAIKAVPTGNRGMHQNVPLETIIIQQATRLNTNKEDAS
jgi:peptidyl-prolyl cis-trans isomerase B (cyclophilin B)